MLTIRGLLYLLWYVQADFIHTIRYFFGANEATMYFMGKYM